MKTVGVEWKLRVESNTVYPWEMGSSKNYKN